MNLPNLETAFTLTWHSSLRACVLIVAVLVIQALAGQRLPARFRYALSLLVLLRLIVLLTPASGWSVFNLTRQVQPAPAAAGPILSFPATPAMAIAFPPSNPPPPALNRSSRLSWGRFGAVVWLCGGAGCLLAVFWRHRKFAHWVAQLPAPGDARLMELVEQCKVEAGVRRGVRIASAPRENSAAVFGFFRPCLLLPEGMMDALERREARLVVLHELLHIRRRDVLVNWISALTLALHWFNPLAWVAMRCLRADQELACDAAVLDLIEPAERGAYGRTLLKHLADFPAARMAAGLVPLITSRHNIKRRIIMITEFRRTGGLARALFAVLLVALGGLTFTRAADPTPAGTNTGPPAAADVTPNLSSLQDNFANDRGLNTTLWTTRSALLNVLGAKISGPPVQFFLPSLQFRPDGMEMFGADGRYKLVAIQSVTAFAPPFVFTTSVEGLVAHGCAFRVFLVNDDASELLVISGNLDSNNGGYYGIGLSGKFSGNPDISAPAGEGELGEMTRLAKLYNNPAIGVFYTFQVAVNRNGSTSVSLMNSSGDVLTKRDDLPILGKGPFHIVLGQSEGWPAMGPGPNVAIWESVNLRSQSPSDRPSDRPLGSSSEKQTEKAQ